MDGKLYYLSCCGRLRNHESVEKNGFKTTKKNPDEKNKEILQARATEIRKNISIAVAEKD